MTFYVVFGAFSFVIETNICYYNTHNCKNHATAPHHPNKSPNRAPNRIVFGIDSLSLFMRKPTTAAIATRFQPIPKGPSPVKNVPLLCETTTAANMPIQTGRIPVKSHSKYRLPLNFVMKCAASMQSVSEGIMVPRFAQNAPSHPAVRKPTKDALLIPSEPGVISATATISSTSSDVIHPYRSTISLMTGIIVIPPKLQNPTFIKDQNKRR